VARQRRGKKEKGPRAKRGLILSVSRVEADEGKEEELYEAIAQLIAASLRAQRAGDPNPHRPDSRA
jgi:hypothetical protein